MSVKVPNEFPKSPTSSYKIAVVGEAPGRQEVEQLRPFVGESGRLLWNEASRNGILRDACFVGNVAQVQPPGNEFHRFDWNGEEIQTGVAQLSKDLEQFQPNLVLCLGNASLHLLKEGNWSPPHHKNGYDWPNKISEWRGSLFNGRLNNLEYKNLAALHPAGILRDYSGRIFLDFDLKRARQEGRSPELVLPQRNLLTRLSVEDQLQKLDQLFWNRPTISIDLEGYWHGVHCISIAESPYECFLIDLAAASPDDEARLLRKLCEVLADPDIPKILQNAMYELFVMQYGYAIPIRGIVDDTMLMWWELFCELPKKLGVLASVCTREPYWKGDREDEDKQKRDLYCCKDSAVTYEIRNVLKKQLEQSPGQLANYQFNLQLQEALIYMQIQGICYDKEKANQLTQEKQEQGHRLQWVLNHIAYTKFTSTRDEWFVVCRDVFCFKKSLGLVRTYEDIERFSKITCLDRARTARGLLQHDLLSISDQGHLAELTETGLNVESYTQVPDFLYRQLGLPVQYKKIKGRLTITETTDVGAMLELYRKTQDPTLKLILKIRSLRGQLETLAAKVDPDGKMRCGYNLLKKETKKTNTSEGGPTATGRLSCTKSLTGSGYNLTTATKSQRCLFIPPADWWLGQCDLAGADGWTVAAHSASCGDSTMLDDLHAGLKIAKNIAVIKEFGRSALSFSRDEFAAAGKKVDKDGWLYFACKRVQHGSNYGMGGATMSAQILKDSFKLFGEPIYVSPATCEALQTLYFQRYRGVLLWHAKLKNILLTKGSLTSASGHKRIFFGRKKDPTGKVNHETFKEMCAEEPQNNTTYATNLALHNMWKDQENWVNKVEGYGRVTLRVQPIHTVHDSLVFQFHKRDTEFVKVKIKEWFNNELMIAGQKIVIPSEGAYGSSWGDLTEGTL